jgi:hypothetical protein
MIGDHVRGYRSTVSHALGLSGIATEYPAG